MPLTIVFGCEFCAPDARFRQHIVYRPRLAQSQQIRFAFTPEARKDGTSYDDELYLIIINDSTGYPIDRVSIPVTVKAEAGVAAPGQNGVRLPSTARMSAPPSQVRPDLIIYAVEAAGPSISLSINPVSAPMRKLLDPLVMNKGKPKSFTSGILDAEAIDQVSTWSFHNLRALSLQEKDLQKLRATGDAATLSDAARDTLVFDPDEAAGAARTLAASGQQLYQKLFFGGPDKSLAKIISLIEQAGAGRRRHPLRIQIVTDRLNVSWQYLHPVGPDVDPKQFWGMRFSLSVMRANDGGKGWRESARDVSPRTVLFAHYGTSSDASVRMAKEQVAALKKALPALNVTTVYAGTEFLELMTSQKDAITALVTFMHASAGMQGSSQMAPHVEFGGYDTVESVDFAVLRNRVPAADQDLRYLARGPIALLNACETGPALKLTQPKLSSELFRLGVKGVIVTEVSVWQSLGDDMANRLLAHLIKGTSAADALTAARRELLAEKNNPLGLLYAYYGDVGATLVPATADGHAR